MEKLYFTYRTCACNSNFVVASYAIYFFSIRITETMKKNNELAIQVSLLNTEVEELRKKMEALEEEDGQDDKDSVRN